jgi:hypothetical protein
MKLLLRTVLVIATGLYALAGSSRAQTSAPTWSSVPPRDDAFGEFGNISQYSNYHIPVANSPTSVTATGVPPGVSFSGSSSDAGFMWSMDRLTGGEFPVTLTATNSAGSSTASFVWTIHPGVKGYIISDKKSYAVGDTITLSALFSAPVVVTGTPYIALWEAKHADYAGGSGTDTLTFRYTVAADDAPRSGVTVDGISLGNGTIATPGGTAASKLDVQQVIGTVLPTFDLVASSSTPPPDNTKTSQTITFASPTGAVTIGQPIALGATSSAGLPIAYSVISGSATLNGNTLTPLSTATLIVRASSAGDATYAAASTDVNFGAPQKAAQTIAPSSTTGDVTAGSTLTLDAKSSSGLPVTYTVLSGPATVSGNTLTLTGTSGTVQVRASQPGNDAYAAANDVTLTFDIIPVPTSRLVNISSRLHVSANDGAGASIAGFVVTSTTPKQFLIRGVGPSLANFGVANPVAAPQLKLYDDRGTVVATNAGWNDDPQIAAAAAKVGGFTYLAGSKDAALLVTLGAGTHTVQLLSDGSGTGLIEVYDVSAATTATKQLVNISTRGTVGSGDDVLIGGFVITGDQPKRVLIRGIGPKLADFGVSGALSDPIVSVYDANQTLIAKNDNWGAPQPLAPGQQVGTATEIAAAGTAAGAFPLTSGSSDAVLLLTLPPGGYSAVVTGAHDASGAAMVEIYEVPE